MAKLTDETRASLRRRSRLVNLGRDAEFSQGFVNVPPFRGSTVLYPDVATLKGRAQRFTYGTRGTPSTEVLSSAWTDLTGAAGTVLLPSGLAAIVVALMTALSAGDHMLMTDSVYSPARAFANKTLKRMGIETTYYDPTIGAGIAALIRPNTRVVFTESPGSETLEVQDIPAIAEAAHGAGACVIMDNTWATPLFFPPHAHGVDMAIEAGTKYLSGHADLLLGLVSANAEWFERLHACVHLMAIPAGPEDVFLALRGLRTMELRLREAERQGLALAQWLAARPEVLRVIHPALPDHPGPRALEARLFRLVGPLFDRAEAGVGGRGRRVPRSASSCSASAIPGAATKASPFRSTARRPAPRRVSSQAGRWCASAPASRTSRI